MSNTIFDLEAALAALHGAEGVLFDFNGTLSLDEDLVGRLYADAAEELCGIELGWEEYERRFVGISDLEICAALSHGDAHLADRILGHMCSAYAREVAERPRIPASHVKLVRRLAEAGIEVGVVTGTVRRLLEPALAATGLDSVVKVTVCCEDVIAGKPSPEGFLRGAALLGVSPERTVVVEDSHAGIGAAHAAGMACVLVGPLAHSAPKGTHPVGDLAALVR
ncbi:HAD family hydrolase [Kitasatospora sp. NPDC048286]|uniref:HAD family hydrolase n=1 Tax=Kitasatospora sp. NPDC048286 TaxID=3364047 RepID=UPI003712D2E0